MCRRATEAMGLQSLMADFGKSANIHLCGDSTAAIGICQRRGLGKLRHVAVYDLWIQDAGAWQAEVAQGGWYPQPGGRLHETGQSIMQP